MALAAKSNASLIQDALLMAGSKQQSGHGMREVADSRLGQCSHRRFEWILSGEKTKALPVAAKVRGCQLFQLRKKRRSPTIFSTFFAGLMAKFKRLGGCAWAAGGRWRG
jgi:hypothetical protein